MIETKDLFIYEDLEDNALLIGDTYGIITQLISVVRYGKAGAGYTSICIKDNRFTDEKRFYKYSVEAIISIDFDYVTISLEPDAGWLKVKITHQDSSEKEIEGKLFCSEKDHFRSDFVFVVYKDVMTMQDVRLRKHRSEIATLRKNINTFLFDDDNLSKGVTDHAIRGVNLYYESGGFIIPLSDNQDSLFAYSKIATLLKY